MKILITNDDSISSEVLLPLAKWVKQFGEVTVVVPKFEQSGKSHCIEIHKPFEVKQVPFDDEDIKAYTVDSSPADCVRFALEGPYLRHMLRSRLNSGDLGIMHGISDTQILMGFIFSYRDLQYPCHLPSVYIHIIANNLSFVNRFRPSAGFSAKSSEKEYNLCRFFK